MSFFKATLSLSVSIGAILWTGMLFALDGRYAPRTTVNEVSELVDAVRDTQIRVISGQLFDIRSRECLAPDAEARRGYAERLAELEAAYYAVSKRYYRLAECTTLR